MKTERSLKILILIGLVAVLSVLWAGFQAKSEIIVLSQASSNNVAIRRESNNKAVLVIDFGDGTRRTFSGKVVHNTTALDFLKQGAGQLKISVGTKDYDFGTLVESIGLRKNGDNNSYWIYYINNKSPDVGADQQIVHAGDNVEFRFEGSI